MPGLWKMWQNSHTIWQCQFWIFFNSKQGLKHVYTHVHSSLIHNSWKVGSNPGAHRQMNGHTKCGTYSRMLVGFEKKGYCDTCNIMNETWRPYIVLSEISPSQKVITWFHILELPRIDTFIETEVRETRRRRRWSYCLTGTEILFGIPEVAGGNGHTASWMYLMAAD